MVHSRAELAKIGEANAEFQQFAKFMRRVSARRDADLMDRAPEAIAGMRIVMAGVGGPPARGGADEDQSQMLGKLVGKFFQRRRLFVKLVGWVERSRPPKRTERKPKRNPSWGNITCDGFRRAQPIFALEENDDGDVVFIATLVATRVVASLLVGEPVDDNQVPGAALQPERDYLSILR